MSNLIRKLIKTIEEVEEDIHHNEKYLKTRIDGYETLQASIINLLKKDDITNDEKIETLKNFFMI